MKTITGYKYRIREVYEQLPRSVTVKQIIDELGIARRTFYKDLAIKATEKADIPATRLQRYAQVLGVSVESLYGTVPSLGKMEGFKFRTKLG